MAKRMSRLKKTIIIASVAVLTLGGAGVALAYWTSSGSGVGTATTGTSVAFTIASLAPVGGPLTPGGPSETVDFTVTNPSTGTQNLALVTVAVANADGSDWIAVTGCSAADYTVEISIPPTYGPIAPAAVVTGGVATVTMINTALNQDACKGASVPLHFVAS